MTSTPAFTRGSVQPEPVRRSNAYGGKCGKCHVWVESGQGFLTGSRQTGWGVEHRVCQPTPVEAPEPTDVQVAEAPSAALPVGRFTVSFEDGTYKTIRVANQAEDASFMPGRQILSFLSGSSNDTDYTAFGHVTPEGAIVFWKRYRDNTVLREAVKVFIGSPDAARLAYAEQSGACSRCGRTLTVPASLAFGMGPECSRKG